MSKAARFDTTLVIDCDGNATRHDNWAGNTQEITIEGRMSHYVVIREKGCNAWSGSGTQSWSPGRIKVVEGRGLPRGDDIAIGSFAMAANQPTWSKDSDRSWRTTVKQALREMAKAESAWEALNEAREESEVEATQAAQDRELANLTAENATNVVANCKAMKTAQAAFFASIKEIEKENGAKFTTSDIQDIMVNAMRRAA